MRELTKNLSRGFLLLVAFLFFPISCNSEAVADAKKIGFLKQAYTECFLNSNPPKKISSISDLVCLKLYPKSFQDEVINDFTSGKVKLYVSNEEEKDFVRWELPGRTIAISILGESEIRRNRSNDYDANKPRQHSLRKPKQIPNN